MTYKWTEEEFRLAYSESRSVRELLSRLGLKPAGGNYKTMKETISRLGLEPLAGKSWSKGKVFGSRRELDSYLVNGKACLSDRLKKRLIKEGIKEHKCESCGLVEWLGKPIALELDHIDGDRYNNLLENLRVLCPNCHAQTSTYRGKNIGKY